MKSVTNAPTTPSDLLTLSSEEVQRLSPEQKEEWWRQCQVREADFSFMVDFVHELYPPCRQFFKADRAAQFWDATANTDEPLYRAFRLLLSLVDTFAADPAFLARFRQNLPKLEASAQKRLRKLKRRKQADKKAKKQAKKQAALAVAPNASAGPDSLGQPAIR